jgi:hypothetical protein
LTGERAGRVWSPEIGQLGCRRAPNTRKATASTPLRRGGDGPGGVGDPWHARKHRVRDPGDPVSDLVHRSKVRTVNRQGYDRDARTQGVGQLRSACLAARISGGLKSRSARGHGPISTGGGHASPAGERGRSGEPDTGTQAQAGDRQGGPGATPRRTPEGRAPTARWGLKGLRSTTGSSSTGALPQMNRSATDGAWSSLP